MLLKYSALTDIGSTRSSQQDSILVIPQLIHNNQSLTNQDYSDDANAAIFAVADGMGGGKQGDLASQLVVKGLSEYILKHKDLLPNDSYSLINSAIYHANEQILDHLNFHPDDLSMGSTVVLGLIQDEKLFIGWVGDSRCYCLDHSGVLTQLSHDHSFVQGLVDDGKITREEAFDHPNRNIINQSLGMPSIIPSFEVTELNNFSKVLLCSDGLNSMLTDEEIQAILVQDLPVDQLNQKLVDMANEKGGDDNISSILISLVSNDTITPSNAGTLTAVQVPVRKKAPWILIVISICLLLSFIFVFDHQAKQRKAASPVQEAKNSTAINDKILVNPVETMRDSQLDTTQIAPVIQDRSYYIRIKVFSNKAQADALVKTLESENNHLNYDVRTSNEGLYEICLLDFNSKDEAVKFLQQRSYPDAVILYKNLAQ